VTVASRDQVHDAGLDDRRGEDRVDAVGHAFEPVTDDEEHVRDVSVAQVGQHVHPELCRLPGAVARPQPEHVAVAVQVDPIAVQNDWLSTCVADLDS